LPVKGTTAFQRGNSLVGAGAESYSDGEITSLIETNLKDWETIGYWICNPSKYIISWAFILSSPLFLCHLSKIPMVALHLKLSRKHFTPKEGSPLHK